MKIRGKQWAKNQKNEDLSIDHFVADRESFSIPKKGIWDDVSSLSESDGSSDDSSNSWFFREEEENAAQEQKISMLVQAMSQHQFKMKNNTKPDDLLKLFDYLEKTGNENFGWLQKRQLKTLLNNVVEQNWTDEQLTALHRQFKWVNYAKILDNIPLQQYVLDQIAGGEAVKSQSGRATADALKTINEAINRADQTTEYYRLLLEKVNIKLSNEQLNDMLGRTQEFSEQSFRVSDAEDFFDERSLHTKTDSLSSFDTIETYQQIENDKIKAIFIEAEVPLRSGIWKENYEAFNAFHYTRAGFLMNTDKKQLTALLEKIVEPGFDLQELTENIYSVKTQEYYRRQFKNQTLKRFIEAHDIYLEASAKQPHISKIDSMLAPDVLLGKNIALINNQFSEKTTPEDYMKWLENVGITLTEHEKKHDLPRMLSEEKERHQLTAKSELSKQPSMKSIKSLLEPFQTPSKSNVKNPFEFKPKETPSPKSITALRSNLSDDEESELKITTLHSLENIKWQDEEDEHPQLPSN